MKPMKLVYMSVLALVSAGAVAAPVVIDRSQGGVGDKPLSIEDRLSKIERILEGRTLMELTIRMEELQREIETLRGETEEQIHQVQNIKQRQRDLYLDIDRRIRELETAKPVDSFSSTPESFVDHPVVAPSQTPNSEMIGESTASPATPPAASVATEAPAAPATTLSSRDFYRQAFDSLKAGKYEESTTQFRQFIEQFPTSSFADNAQYWIGEAMYALHRFDDALAEFQKILDTYPDSAKIPDAKLKMGYSQYEKGDFAAAREILESLRGSHPNSTAASLAVKRLQTMKIEGQ